MMDRPGGRWPRPWEGERQGAGSLSRLRDDDPGQQRQPGVRRRAEGDAEAVLPLRLNEFGGGAAPVCLDLLQVEARVEIEQPCLAHVAYLTEGGRPAQTLSQARRGAKADGGAHRGLA